MAGPRKEPKFMIRMNTRDHDVPSFSTCKTPVVQTMKRNHLSNIFSQLQNDKTRLDSDSKMNLFGSRLEEPSNNGIRSNRAPKLSADEQNPLVIKQLLPVLDRLAKKDLLNENDELTAEAHVDSNCAKYEPTLNAMINWADQINEHWLYSNRTLLRKLQSHLNPSGIIEAYNQTACHKSMSEQLFCSEKLQSRIAFSNYRDASSIECTQPLQTTVTSNQNPEMTNQPNHVQMDPTSPRPQISALKTVSASEQKEKSKKMAERIPSNDLRSQVMIADPNLFESSLEPTADKETLNLEREKLTELMFQSLGATNETLNLSENNTSLSSIRTPRLIEDIDHLSDSNYIAMLNNLTESTPRLSSKEMLANFSFKTPFTMRDPPITPRLEARSEDDEFLCLDLPILSEIDIAQFNLEMEKLDLEQVKDAMNFILARIEDEDGKDNSIEEGECSD